MPAAVADKPKAKRERRVRPVYFTTEVPCGWLPSLKPEVKRLREIGNGQSTYETLEPAVDLHFRDQADWTYMGRTKALMPDDPADAYVIDEARKAIAAGKDPRIEQFGLKEISPDAPPIPFPGWESFAAEELVSMVKKMCKKLTGAEKISYLEKCVQFETARIDKAREGLILDLEELQDEELSEEDPLAVPEL